MQNKRRHFRVNAEIPIYVYRLQAHAPAASQHGMALSAADREQIEHVKLTLARLFSEPKHVASGAAALFMQFDQQLDFVFWMLERFFHQQNPLEHAEFRERRAHALAPLQYEALRQSKVYPLMQAFNRHVERLIHFLLLMAECSHSDRVLYIGDKLVRPFSAESYLHNLDTLAQQGNWLSQVLVALVAKLNLSESACRQLKRYGDGVPQPAEWALQQANLSVGGIAMHTPDDYEVSEQVVLFLQIESQPLVVDARVVNVLRLEEDGTAPASSLQAVTSDKTSHYRVAFEFEHLDADQLALITRFVTAQELALAHPQSV